MELCNYCFKVVPDQSTTKVECESCPQKYCSNRCSQKDVSHTHSLIGPPITSNRTRANVKPPAFAGKVKKLNIDDKKKAKQQQEKLLEKLKTLKPQEEEEETVEEEEELPPTEPMEEEEELITKKKESAPTPLPAETIRIMESRTSVMNDIAKMEYTNMMKNVTEFVDDMNSIFTEMNAKVPNLTQDLTEWENTTNVPEKLKSSPEQLNWMQAQVNTLFGPVGKSLFVDSTAVKKEIETSVERFNEYLRTNKEEDLIQGEHAILRAQAHLMCIDSSLVESIEMQRLFQNPERMAIIAAAKFSANMEEICRPEVIVQSYYNPYKKAQIDQFWADMTGDPVNEPTTALIGANGEARNMWERLLKCMNVSNDLAKAQVAIQIGYRHKPRFVPKEIPAEFDIDIVKDTRSVQKEKSNKLKAWQEEQDRLQNEYNNKYGPEPEDKLYRFGVDFFDTITAQHIKFCKNYIVERKSDNPNEQTMGVNTGPKLTDPMEIDLEADLKLYQYFKEEEEGIIARMSDRLANLSMKDIPDSFTSLGTAAKSIYGNTLKLFSREKVSKTEMFKHGIKSCAFHFITAVVGAAMGTLQMSAGGALANWMLPQETHSELMKKHYEAMQNANTDQEKRKANKAYRANLNQAIEDDKTCPVPPTSKLMVIGGSIPTSDPLDQIKMEANLLMRKIIVCIDEMATESHGDAQTVARDAGKLLKNINDVFSDPAKAFPDLLRPKAKTALQFTPEEKTQIYNHRAESIAKIRTNHLIFFDKFAHAILNRELIPVKNIENLEQKGLAMTDVEQKMDNKLTPMRKKYFSTPERTMDAATAMAYLVSDLRLAGIGGADKNLSEIENDLKARYDTANAQELKSIVKLHKLLSNSFPKTIGTDLQRTALKRFCETNGYTPEQIETLLKSPTHTIDFMFNQLVDQEVLNLADNINVEISAKTRETLSKWFDTRVAFDKATETISKSLRTIRQIGEKGLNMGYLMSAMAMNAAVSTAASVAFTGTFTLLTVGTGAAAILGTLAAGAAYDRMKSKAKAAIHADNVKEIGKIFGLDEESAKQMDIVQNKLRNKEISWNDYLLYRADLENKNSAESAARWELIPEVILTGTALYLNAPGQLTEIFTQGAIMGGFFAAIAGLAYNESMVDNPTWGQRFRSLVIPGSITTIAMGTSVLRSFYDGLASTHIRIPGIVGHIVLFKAGMARDNVPWGLGERLLTEWMPSVSAVATGYTTLWLGSKLVLGIIRLAWNFAKNESLEDGWLLTIAPTKIHAMQWKNADDKTTVSLFYSYALGKYRDYLMSKSYKDIILDVMLDPYRTLNSSILTRPQYLRGYNAYFSNLVLSSNDQKLRNAGNAELELINTDLFPDPYDPERRSIWGAIWGTNDTSKGRPSNSIFQFYNGPLDDIKAKIEKDQQEILNEQKENRLKLADTFKTAAEQSYTLTHTVNINQPNTKFNVNIFNLVCEGIHDAIMDDTSSGSTRQDRAKAASNFAQGLPIFVAQQQMCHEYYTTQHLKNQASV